MIYYPLTTGRNTDEILRLIDALQTTDEHHVAMPANWRPGDDVIVSPPNTQEATEERLKQGYECKDWYFCKKRYRGEALACISPDGKPTESGRKLLLSVRNNELRRK